MTKRMAVIVECETADGEIIGGISRFDLAGIEAQKIANEEGVVVRIFDAVTDKLLCTVKPSRK